MNKAIHCKIKLDLQEPYACNFWFKCSFVKSQADENSDTKRLQKTYTVAAKVFMLLKSKQSIWRI